MKRKLIGIVLFALFVFTFAFSASSTIAQQSQAAFCDCQHFCPCLGINLDWKKVNAFCEWRAGCQACDCP